MAFIREAGKQTQRLREQHHLVCGTGDAAALISSPPQDRDLIARTSPPSSRRGRPVPRGIVRRPLGGRNVINSAECRKRAEEARHKAADPQERAFWLQQAQQWRLMAQEAAKM